MRSPTPSGHFHSPSPLPLLPVSSQVIVDIIFVIGVNPLSQSSQSALYNPMLMMCQNIQSTPSLSASLGAGFPGGFPMYNRYLYHYCYMDPEEVPAPLPSVHSRFGFPG